ncbi:MAG: heme-binding domain-containing protein [Rikenellaceae bacterium]
MSKLSKTILGLLITTAALVITFRAINQEPSENLILDAKVVAIIDNSGCIVCHSQNPKLPFYSKWPLLGGKITRDAASAYSAIDLEPYFEAIKTGDIVDDSVLTRLENVINDHSMPPISYTILRLGSAVSSKEENILKEWITLRREKNNKLY